MVARYVHFIVPSERIDIILSEGTDVHIQQKAQTRKKHKQGIQLCYGVYNETK